MNQLNKLKITVQIAESLTYVVTQHVNMNGDTCGGYVIFHQLCVTAYEIVVVLQSSTRFTFRPRKVAGGF